MSNDRRSRQRAPTTPALAVVNAFRDDPRKIFDRDPVDPETLASSLTIGYQAPDVTPGAQEKTSAPANSRQEEGRAASPTAQPAAPAPKTVQAAAEPPAAPSNPPPAPNPVPAAAQPAPQVSVPQSPPAAPSVAHSAPPSVAPQSPPPSAVPATEEKPAPAKQPQFVNITVNLDKQQVEALNRISAMEQIRFGRKVSASEVLRRCLDFALERVPDNKVLIDEAGAGLKLGGAQ